MNSIRSKRIAIVGFSLLSLLVSIQKGDTSEVKVNCHASSMWEYKRMLSGKYDIVVYPEYALRIINKRDPKSAYGWELLSERNTQLKKAIERALLKKSFKLMTIFSVIKPKEVYSTPFFIYDFMIIKSNDREGYLNIVIDILPCSYTGNGELIRSLFQAWGAYIEIEEKYFINNQEKIAENIILNLYEKDKHVIENW